MQKKQITSISLWIGFLFSIAYVLIGLFGGYWQILMPLALANFLKPIGDPFTIWIISSTLMAVALGALFGSFVRYLLLNITKTKV